MSLSVKKGTFAANTTTGNQAITGLGFQPKFVVFWTNGKTADGSSATSDTNRTCRGFAVSSSARCSAGYTIPDNVSSTAGEIVWDEASCIYLVETAGTAYCTADFVSNDADGFTVNWTAAPAAAVLVHYWAVGGSDITNVKLGFETTLSGSQNPGTKATTGMGFQPTAMMVLSSGRTATGVLATSTPQTSHGFATAAGQFVQHASGTASASDVLYGTSTSNVGQIQSLDSDGFTMNYHPAPSSAVRFAYLAWKGANAYVGTSTEPTTNTSSAKTGVGFQPSAALFTGLSGLAAASKASWFIGATDGTNHGSTTVVATNANPIRAAINGISTAPIKIIGNSGGASTNKGDAAFTSFDSDGETLTWTNTDGTGRTYGMLLLASTSVPSVPIISVAPAVTGNKWNGQTLSCSTGTWSASPTSYSYQWQRDTAGNGTYTNIASATSSTYTLTASDVSNNVRCVVTATNGAGSGTPANSNVAGLIGPRYTPSMNSGKLDICANSIVPIFTPGLTRGTGIVPGTTQLVAPSIAPSIGGR